MRVTFAAALATRQEELQIRLREHVGLVLNWRTNTCHRRSNTCLIGGSGWRGPWANVIEFPSMEQLRAWYDSPEYALARDIARNALRRRLLFVEGVGPT